MKPLSLLFLVACTAVAFATTACKDPKEFALATGPVEQANRDVLVAAAQVVGTLTAKDGAKLADLVHPQKGVRFSPYAYVDVETDRVLSRSQVATFWQDSTTYTWGSADGTGDPIEMTQPQYCDRFIMDRDFANPSSINVNDDRANGNTNNNAASVYPEGTRVELYIAPAPGKGEPEFDWAALRLVFEQVAGSWYLIAVIHDEWTT